jgi:branched-chain amino acid transport system permease protein
MVEQKLPAQNAVVAAPAEPESRERDSIDHDASLRGFARRRHRELAVAGVAALAIALLPLVIHDVYLQNILVLTLMYAALSQSWNILGGYCGQISLGHAIYFGIGAYMSTLLYTHAGITPWLGMLAGGGVAALIALALGYPFFRLRGHYFTIATIVVAETGLLLVLNWDFAGGAQGIQIPYGPDSWAHLQFARDKLPYIYFALGLAVLTWLVTFAIEDSKWGYWWRAVKDNAEAAESLGVVVFRSKMAAAALSAFFTAIGGSFYAAFVSYIDPDSVMGFQFSLLIALPAVLGGIGTLWGPALGALVLIPLTELTRSSFGGSGNGLDLIIYGVLIMVISLARPEGLTSLFARRRGARAGLEARAKQ